MPKTSRRTFFRSVAGAGALAASGTFPLSAKASDISGLKLAFVQVSDTHLSTERLYSERQQFDVPSEESIRRNRLAVKDINACSLPYELIVHTGDVAHTRETTVDYDLAKEILRFERPTYYVPGNHDVGYSETDQYRPPFEERFGPANQAIEPVPGLRFALFDSQPLDTRAPDTHREEAFRQLDRILTPPKPTILFCHVMGLPSFHINQLHEGWPPDLMWRWTERMKQGGVLAVLAGHFHRDEYHIVNGLPFHLAGPVINFWGRQTCYRHWRLENGALTHRTIYLEI